MSRLAFILACIVGIVALVLAVTKQMNVTEAGLFGGLALAVAIIAWPGPPPP